QHLLRPGMGDLDLVQTEGSDLRQHHAAVHDQPSGMRAKTRVPAPRELSTVSVPLRAATRSSRPRSPEPAAGSAPPTPSSATSTSMQSPPLRTLSRASVACAYFVTFVNASATTKYAAASTAGAGRASRSEERRGGHEWEL